MRQHRVKHTAELRETVIIFHHSYEQPGVKDLLHHCRDVLASGQVVSKGRKPQLKRLVLPDLEGVGVNHSWLNNFLGREHPPGHGVDGGEVAPRPLPRAVAGHVVHAGEGTQHLRQDLHVLPRAEELNVLLLVHVAPLGAPAQCRVVGPHSVSAGLGVDRQEATAVEPLQHWPDQRGLGLQWCLEPGQKVRAPLDELQEDVDDVLKGSDVPQGRSAAAAVGDQHAAHAHGVREVPEGRRPRVPPAPVRELIPEARLRQVAGRPVGPKDGPDLLIGVPGGVRGHPPRQLAALLLGQNVELVQNTHDALLQVQAVEMEPSYPGRPQGVNNRNHRLHALLLHCLLVLFHGGNPGDQLGGDPGPQLLHNPTECLEGVHRHDPANDRHFDPQGPAIPLKLQKHRGVVHKLGHDEACAGIHLLLQVLKINLVGHTRERQAAGIPRNSNAEVVVVSLTNEPDQLSRVLQDTLLGRVVGLPTKGKYVPEAFLAGASQSTLQNAERGV
eukprot:RCo019416